MQNKAIVAEDDPGIREVLKIILENAGYLTSIYHTGAELLEDTFVAPDIFIIDKRLPGIDGLDVCATLKKRSATAKVPVIILSATPNIENLVAQSGANVFMEKPFSKKQLLETMDVLINEFHHHTKPSS